jgi:hypothetical protein
MTAGRIDLISGLPDPDHADELTDAEFAEYRALRVAALNAMLGFETTVTCLGTPTATIGPPRGSSVDRDVWWPPRRGVFSGHRVPADGRPPAPSRTLGWRFWAFEYLWRLQARLMRGQPQHVRDGLQPAPGEEQ